MKESWTVSSGNGGLDTGSVESRETNIVYVIAKRKRWFNFFIPRRVEIMFSTGANPTSPKGYTDFRRIGRVR